VRILNGEGGLMSDKRIVEINGVKIEVDLRTAKRVDEFKVGDPVKILIKNYSGYKSHVGMIVGFDEFKSLPTIIIAYLVADRWSSNPLCFAYLNAESKDIEICAHEPNDMGVERSDILNSFRSAIDKKVDELKDLESKREYFDRMFGNIFPSKSEQ
jgi:hypothetical protein